MNSLNKKYTSNDYLRQNPSWGMEDSPWKTAFVADMLRQLKLKPDLSICEVGCGAGGVLRGLRELYPHAELHGYDIAPDAAGFWPEHASADIKFQTGDFFTLNRRKYDVVLLLDVIEHIENPFSFLSELRHAADCHIFHIPLDLCAAGVLREAPLIKARKKTGHIHYFTKNLALMLLEECGYNIIDWKYSGAAFNTPQKNWKVMLAALPRRLAYMLNKEWGVRALGGETLFVLTRKQQ